MVLVLDVLDHIGRIYNPLNLANMKNKIVRNTAPDNQRVLNFMRNPHYWLAHIHVFLESILI